MTDGISSFSSAWSWGTELVEWVLAPAQAASPHPTQDADLLRQLPFVPALKELLMLRQVHALEHATVWVLSEATRLPAARQQSWAEIDNQWLGGLSTDRGFYLYGQVDVYELSRAVQIALRRITTGDWNLAVHPRCGTNLSVGMLLTTSLVVGMAVLLPKGPIEQLIGVGCAAAIAGQLTPELGSLAQRYITTAVPFNLAIERIAAVRDHLGRSAHFVQVRWVD
jgi:hypothetical protein